MVCRQKCRKDDTRIRHAVVTPDVVNNALSLLIDQVEINVPVGVVSPPIDDYNVRFIREGSLQVASNIAEVCSWRGFVVLGIL